MPWVPGTCRNSEHHLWHPQSSFYVIRGTLSFKFQTLALINELLATDVLLVSKILLGYEEAFWSKKIKDKACQSNLDKRASDFGFFLVI